MPVGIVASQPMVLGGALDVNAADKAARFVWLCDAFGIPLVFLHDVPGFIVGSAVEKQGIIRHGAKMLFAVSEATVPKVSIVLRKSYGAGYFVMNGTAYEADYVAIWPTAEIAVMGPDGMVEITRRKELDQLEGQGAQRAQDRPGRGVPQEHRPVHRGRLGPGGRRDRPGRHPLRHLEGPPGLQDQADRPALAQARRVPRLDVSARRSRSLRSARTRCARTIGASAETAAALRRPTSLDPGRKFERFSLVLVPGSQVGGAWPGAWVDRPM